MKADFVADLAQGKFSLCTRTYSLNQRDKLVALLTEEIPRQPAWVADGEKVKTQEIH